MSQKKNYILREEVKQCERARESISKVSEFDRFEISIVGDIAFVLQRNDDEMTYYQFNEFCTTFLFWYHLNSSVRRCQFCCYVQLITSPFFLVDFVGGDIVVNIIKYLSKRNSFNLSRQCVCNTKNVYVRISFEHIFGAYV